MDTQKLIARLRERAATQDACGCWSLDRAVADELERLVASAQPVAALQALTDEELLALIKQVDPRAVRIPPGVRAIADALLEHARAGCS